MRLTTDVSPAIAPSTQSEELQNARVKYSETMATIRSFYQSRHRVTAQVFTVVAALLALGSWMWEHQLGHLTALPFALGAFWATLSIVHDARNQAVLNILYAEGSDLYLELGSSDGGFCQKIRCTGARRLLTYGWTLRLAYSIIAASLATLAVFALLNAPGQV
jgi:hypothetical protein